ncbi:MAG: hypothetical protein IPQ06_00320 [Chitinophagaceae bacterium]|nr:hypothetical protein [Chitinophagaceae bacterium]
MKLFRKILFWLYLTVASVALVLVIIYLVNSYGRFSKEVKFGASEKSFSKHFLSFNKPDSSFSSLFSVPPDIAVDFLNRSESRLEIPHFKSQAIQISKDEIQKLDQLVKYWPPKFQNISKYNLLSIYIVDSARFNGLTQIIKPTDDKFIIFLNARLFHTTPNEWITFETTKCLKNEFRHKVKCSLFNEDQNIPIRTVEHVLLHEYAHIFSFISREAPLPDDWFSSKSGYFPLIETCFDGGYISYESKKEGLEKLELLSQNRHSDFEKLTLEEFKELNKRLVNSPFPTAYSTRNGSELVAELFTLYIHQMYFKQLFSMTVDDGNPFIFAQKIDTSYVGKLLE